MRIGAVVLRAQGVPLLWVLVVAGLAVLVLLAWAIPLDTKDELDEWEDS